MKITVRQLKQLIKEQVEESISDEEDSSFEDKYDYMVDKLRASSAAREYIFNNDNSVVSGMPISLFCHITGFTEEEAARLPGANVETTITIDYNSL